MQRQRTRILILTIIIILVIYFILFQSDKMMQELDQQMPLIGVISLGILQPRALRGKSFRHLIRSIIGLFFLTCFVSSGYAQVTISGSGGAANGSYTTLKLAFDALNAVNTQAGNSISLTITASITDNNSAVLNQPSVSSWTNLTITPSGGSWTLSGSINAPLLDLNGADHVIIDGLNTGGNALTISNTSTSAVTGTSTIRLINDSSNNTITNCSIKGSSTGNAAQSGLGIIPVTATIIIAGTNSAAGNDNNTITNNTIAEAGTNLPTVAICSSGQSTSISNDLSVIIGNNIANFYGGNGANGIAVVSNSSAFTISANKFYQTAARSGLSSSKYLECIFINTPSGGGYIISNNIIGYASADGTGMLINTNGRFAGIDITAVPATPVSEIQGNTINGINWASDYNSSSTSDAAFYGILVRAGGLNVGTSTGNTVGAVTGNGSTTTNLYITNVTSGISSSMIYLSSAVNCTISNNHIGAIAMGAGNIYFFGISIEGTGSHSILSNDIGGSTVGSITLGMSGGNFGNCYFRGIYCNATGNEIIGIATHGNTIQHITYISQNYSEFNGIINNGTALSLSINYNTLEGIVYSATPGITNSSFWGIVNYGNVSNSLTINYNQLGTAGSGLISYDLVFGNAQGDFHGIYVNTLASAAALSIINNDFRGITFAGTGSVVLSLIYWNHSGSVTDNINDNTFTNLNMNTIGFVTFMERAGNMTSTGVENVNGNTIVTGFTKNASGNYVTFYNGMGSSVTGSVSNNQSNNFSNVTVGGQTHIDGWVNQNGNSSSNGPTKIITNNIFNNLIASSNANAAVQGMSVNYASAGSVISSNTFQNLTGGGSVTAINLWINNSTNGSITVSQNLISGLNSQAGSSTYGIYSQMFSAVISKNKICDLTSTNASGFVKGIFMDTPLASGGTNTISNNLIGNLTAPSATGSNAVIGIDLTSNISPSTYNVYYNTIYLASTGGNGFGSSGINHQTSVFADKGKLNLRNNIIINLSTPGTGGLSVAFRRSNGNGGDLNNYANTSNNNMFYAGTPATNHLIYYDGIGNAQTIEAYRAGVFNAGVISPRDAQSVSQAIVPGSFFLSTSSVSSDFLHINPANPTQIESGGTPIAGQADDFDGDARNAQVPDIGADEGMFILSDHIGPLISYTLIPNGVVANTQSFTNVIITDLSNVEGNAGIRPRVYYKRSTDANTFTDNTSSTPGWKFVEANGSTSPFAFTMDYTLLSGGGVSVGNAIQYFVVAQDQIVPPNVGMFSGVYANSPVSVALTSTAFPIAGPINSFIILTSFNGTISVPGSYPTLTGSGGVFEAINAGIVTGNLNIQINGNITTETGLISLTEFAAPYTIKIYPIGVARTLSGSISNTGLIRLNGADRVTIDGSIGGTSTDKSLTIINTSSTVPSVIVLQSLGTGAGAHHNTVKNCNISFGNSNATGFGISVSGSTPGTPGADNDDVTIQNNNITSVSNGIYANGTASSSAGGDDSLQLIGNTIVINTSASECTGIRVGNALNSNISTNTLNVFSTVPIYPVGISLETGFVSSVVTSNKILAVLSSGTTGYGARGITVGTGTTSSNLTIANNVIYNVNGSNNSIMTNSSMGICIGLLGSSLTTSTTGGVKIYYNSVNIYASIGIFANAITTALYIGSAASNLDIRDNIFSNTQSGTSNAQKNYAIYSAAPSSAFSSINYNDYYVSNSFYPAGAIPGFLTSDRIDLPAIQTGFGQNINSIIANPFFFANDDLRPSSGYVVGGADNTGTGITSDFLSVARHTGTPPMGSTMGAYENPFDVTAPVIQLTTISTSCSTSDRIFTGTITDNLGVPVTGSFVPRVYFKKNTGAYFSTPGVLTSGNGINGVWTFTITASTLGGLTGGDVISYFVICQDLADPINIKSNPSAGLVATNVNNVTTPPVSPITNTVLYTFGPGSYSVGSGTIPNQLGHFSTLTNAVQAYNNGCMAGPTVFVLTDVTYSGGETFPLTINQNAQASSTNTLTIKPATGVTTVISGSASTVLVDFNGADYVAIDGSSNGTNTKDLTISNTNTSGAVIRFINDATQNAVKNCILKGVSTSNSNGVVYIASTTLTTGNDYNLIQNNDITAGNTAIAIGIYNSGNVNSSTLKNSNLQIIGNNIYNFSYTGIYDNGGSVGTVYQQNQIYEINSQNTGGLIGFGCFSNTIEGFIFRGNRIYDLKLNGSGVYGIYVHDIATGPGYASEISNNMISLNATQNCDLYGMIDFTSGTYLNIFYNSISISGSNPGYSAGYYRFGINIINFKNNIVSNMKINNTNSWAMFMGGGISNLSSDYNNLFVSSYGAIGFNASYNLYNLSQWQSVTNEDLHSVSVATAFITPSDLHLATNGNCNLDGAGITISGITDDYDGTSRLSPPDIGADEFTATPLGPYSAGPAQTICAASTPLAATPGPAGSIGTWTVVTGTGTFQPNANTPSATVSGMAPGLNTYKWTVNFGTCSTNSTVNVTNNSTAFTQCPAYQLAMADPATCTSIFNYTAVAIGTPAPTLSHVFSGATTGSGAGTGSGSAFNVGVTNIAITANNGCGVNAVCNFSVEVQTPEINVSGNAINIPDGQTIPSLANQTDFDTIMIDTSLTRTFTIYNGNSGDLNINNISISGPGASMFTVSPPNQSTVNGYQSTWFTVLYAPTSLGVHTATIHIATNDCDESDFDFAIKGTGDNKYYFTGQGYWTDQAKWTPYYPGLTLKAGFEAHEAGQVTSLNIPPSTTVTINGSLLYPSWMECEGNLIINNGGLVQVFTIYAEDSITNNTGGQFIIDGGQLYVSSSPILGTVINSGTINAINGGAYWNEAYFYNNPGGLIINNSDFTNLAAIFDNHGTYAGNGSFHGHIYNYADGIISPGNSPGCQTVVTNPFDDDAYIDNQGTFQMEINGAQDDCMHFDKVTIGGPIYLGGTLNVSVGYTPQNTDAFTIIDAEAITGVFNTVNIPSGWSVHYNDPLPGKITLRINCTSTAITSQPIASQTLCQNTTPSTLAVTATGTGLQYQWYVDTDNTGYNGTSIDGATSSNYIPGTSVAGTKYYYVIVSGTCGVVNSQYAAVKVNETGRWLGTVNSDWHTASNWCGGVPDMATDVIIGPAPFQPVVSSANAICHHLSLLPTTALDIHAPRQLKVMQN